MRLLPDRIFELDDVSTDVARELVDRVFHQTFNIIIGVSVFSVLGVFGIIVTGSLWYAAGVAAVIAAGTWRLWLFSRYRRARSSATPVVWARRSLWASSAMACVWGAWGIAAVFETHENLVVLIVCVQGATVLFSAVHNATLRVIAVVQACLTLVPVFLMLMLSDDWTYRLYGVFIIPFFANVLSYNTFLHRQTLRLLRADREKAELLVRLEAAKQELEVINRHLETLAAMDALTGVANRRAFDLTSAREWLRAARESVPMSLLLLDIDHFKAFNDFYGHQAGDACLRTVAAMAASVIRRPADMLARYGGEEFAVILPGIGLDDAVRIAEQIRTVIDRRHIPHDASEIGHVTVSIGAACLVPRADSEVGILTARADAALYAAKRCGRNRVIAPEAIEPEAAGAFLPGRTGILMPAPQQR
nr:diguanylate cyclase [uncultured Rhodopila sp.]